MKNILLLILLFVIGGNSIAQNGSVKTITVNRFHLRNSYFINRYNAEPVPFSQNPGRNELRKAKHLKVSGIVSTSIGATLAGLGTASVIGANRATENAVKNNKPKGNGLGLLAGYSAIGAGAIMMGVGIPRWITGNRRLKKYNNRLQLGTGNGVVSISYRF